MRDRRGSTERGYGYRWQKARAGYLSAHPLCRFCHEKGRVTPATVVDHIRPHRGDMSIFWDSSNWQALCAPCHDTTKAQLERSGTIKGCDVEGRPLDPTHHWSV